MNTPAAQPPRFGIGPAAMWAGLFALAALALALRAWPARPTPEPPAGFMWTAVLAGHDTIAHDYPAAMWGWGRVRAGELPLWNPSWFGGQPFIASQTFMPFYPANWLGGVLPFPLAFNIQYPLHLCLAACAMTWAARRRGFGWWAAGLAGLSWGFGSHLATLAGAGHVQKLQALAWLPVVAHGGFELTRGWWDTTDAKRGSGRWRGATPPAVGLAMQILAGHPHIVYLSLMAAGCEVLINAVRAAMMWRQARKSAGAPAACGAGLGVRLVRPIPVGVMILVVALGLSAVFWIPTAEFARGSNRAVPLTWQDQTRGSLPPEEAVEFVLPRLRGDSMPHGRGPYAGRYGESPTSSPERVVSDYVGAGVLLFALLALIDRQRRKTAAIYWIFAAFALALSCGRYLEPIYRTALAVIPGLANLRAPSVMMALAVWALVSAAAMGLEGFVRRMQSGERTVLWPPILITMLSLPLAGILLLLDHAGLGGLAARAGLTAPSDQAHFLLNIMFPAIGHALLALGCLAACVAIVVAFATHVRMSAVALAGAVLGIGVWAVDLHMNARPFWNAEPAAPYHRFLRNHWALPTWRDGPQPVRFIEPGNELSNRALTLSQLEANPPLIISSTHGYHPVNDLRYFRLAEATGFLHPSFIRLMAMNYLLWPGEAEQAPPGFRPTAAGNGRTLFFNPEPRYARPVRAVEVLPDAAARLERLSDPNRDPYAITLFTSGSDNEHADGYISAVGDTRVKITARQLAPGAVLIRQSGAPRASIVVAEPAQPGWRAFVHHVDTFTEIPVHTADHYFVCVTAREGQRVLLVYDPVSQRLGLHVTLVTLAALACVAGRVTRRRFRQAVPAAVPIRGSAPPTRP